MNRAASLREALAWNEAIVHSVPTCLLDGGDELGMLLADVHVHQLRREVEVPATVRRPGPAALGAGDHHRRERSLGGPGMEDVGNDLFVGAAVLWAVSRAVMESH